MTLQDRQDAFVEYLKDKHVRAGILTRKNADEIPNDEFLLNIRHNNAGEEVISIEEFNGIVLENTSYEKMDKDLEEIFEEKSVSKRLNNIFNNLSEKIIPIRVPHPVPRILDDISLCGSQVSIQQAQQLIDDTLSIFPEWVYNANNFYVCNGRVLTEHSTPNELLLMSLTAYNTFGEWASEVLTGETEFEGKKLIAKTFGADAVEVMAEAMTSFIENIEEEPSKEFKKVYQDLFNQIIDYLMRLPLIAVWKKYEVQAKTVKEKKDKLVAELTEIAEEKLVPYFQKGVRVKEKSEFLNRIKSVLPSMTKDQIVAAYRTNFGIDMPKIIQQEFDTILKDAMKGFNETF
jgi:hypothetical protein